MPSLVGYHFKPVVWLEFHEGNRALEVCDVIRMPELKDESTDVPA